MQKAIYYVFSAYRRCRGMIDDDEDLPADVPADLVDYLENMFVQEGFSGIGGVHSFTAGDRSVASTAFLVIQRQFILSVSNSPYSSGFNWWFQGSSCTYYRGREEVPVPEGIAVHRPEFGRQFS